MSNILVTGGAGFIGSNLVGELLKQGYNVRILDMVPPKSMEKAEFIKGDIRDLEAVKRSVKGMDYVLHLAAQVSVAKSVEYPLETNDINVNGTLNVLSASKDAGVKRVVFSSSCSVYGNSGKSPLSETSKTSQESPYALTKFMGEEYCRIFSKLYGLETASLRYFNVYGPGQSPDSPYASAIPRFVSDILAGRVPKVFGDGEQTRDFIFVKDVVKANILAMKAGGVSGQVFNIGSGKSTTINRLIDSIGNMLGIQIKPDHKRARKGDVRYSSADVSKANKILGFKPEYSMKEGLRLTIEWLKSKS